MEEKIIIVDTDIIINHVNQKSSVLSNYLKLQNGGKLTLVVSTITIFEYYSGTSLEFQAKKEESQMLFAHFFKQPVTEEISKLAALINRINKLFGKIGLGDLMVGSTSIYLAGKLLTANKKHFKLIPDLQFVQ